MVKRVLMYAQGEGLGHLRRARNIARAILERDPGCSVLILSDHRSAPFFEAVPGIDCIKLPLHRPMRRPDLVQSALNLEHEQMNSLRENVILSAYRAFDPQAVLVDFLPNGARAELNLLLEEATRRTSPPRLYLGIRDILRSPEETSEIWSYHGAYDYLSYYHAALVYGSPALFDTDAAYSLSSYVKQVIYCNFVAPSEESPAPAPALAEEPILLVMGGSGQDSVAMQTALVRALPVIQENIPLPIVLLTGPGMLPEDRQTVVEQAQSASKPVQILGSVRDATRLIEKAELIVSLGGYNSLCEVVQLQKKALIVPYARSSEQRMRAQIFQDLGMLRLLFLEDLTPERLAEELISLYRADDIPNPAHLPPFDGAQRAAAVILGEEQAPN
ncbi:MAG: glycosyltransferase family protein [Dehalococcoidia bacterium]